MLEVVRAEAVGCRDIPKLLAMVGVLCHLAGLAPSGSAQVPAVTALTLVSTQALQALLVLLVNRYPKVRKYTAEQLYVRLLTLQEDDADDEEGEGGAAEAMEVLSQTRWVTPTNPSPEVH